MIENKNPDEDIFNFNTEANSGSLYDAIYQNDSIKQKL